MFRCFRQARSKVPGIQSVHPTGIEMNVHGLMKRADLIFGTMPVQCCFSSPCGIYGGERSCGHVNDPAPAFPNRCSQSKSITERTPTCCQDQRRSSDAPFFELLQGLFKRSPLFQLFASINFQFDQWCAAMTKDLLTITINQSSVQILFSNPRNTVHLQV